MVIINSKIEAVKSKTKVLNHLGLVAGMCKEIGIADIINEQIPNESPDKILSTGIAIEGLILNGLGFINKRLYLVSRFFKNKPVDKLLGISYLTSEHFNDDALGRALDLVYDYGISELYALVSSAAIALLNKKYGLKIESGQLDNTNFHLHGKAKELELSDGRLINITHGHSKDHRPDLVQIGLQLIVDHQSRIPLLMNILSGNEEEGKSYGDFVKRHAKQLQTDYDLEMLVVDSKLYNQKNLALLGRNETLKWVTRVPHSLKAVKELLAFSDKNEFQQLKNDDNYSYQVICSNYGSVKQRWVVFHSQNKYGKDLKQFNKQVAKQNIEDSKAAKKLSKQNFDTSQEALQAAHDFSKHLKYNNLDNIEVITKKYYDGVGKPKKGQDPTRIAYKLEVTIKPNIEFLDKKKSQLGYFILATNELDQTKMTAEQVLSNYKNQAGVERGFRFLKDPNIVGSSLFVQKPERMMAIIMIMTLCLLVYSALEFKARALLKTNDLTFNNRLGKPIQNPTMKWIFECFEGIHVLYQTDCKPVVTNLEEEHELILNLFGSDYWRFYT